MKGPFLLLSFVLLPVLFVSCKEENTQKPESSIQDKKSNTETALNLMQKHLDAVSDRDLETLESTLSPHGNMQLILPGMEIIENTDGFMDYHREWFKADNWTLDSKISNFEIGDTMAMIIVKSIYREAERDGVPYFNRMTVSYDLKKIKGNWFVIKDHMASVQKSTDPK